jgi:hypothetical protein
MRHMHGADPSRFSGLADRVALLARSPGIRTAFGDITTIAAGVKRPYRAAVALGNGDPAAWSSVVAEFRRLQQLGVAQQFVIGLRPQQAEAAIAVLESELEDDSLTVEVFVDDAVEKLVGERTLELVAPGEAGTGRAPIHEYELLSSQPRSGKSSR